MEVVSGGNITLTCSAQPGHLRAYRWVYIRTGTKRPQVLSSGRRLVVGEPRIALDSKAEDEKVKLKLTLTDIRPYESGIFMCWRQGLKPDPQILLTVLGTPRFTKGLETEVPARRSVGWNLTANSP
ncbi:uncharacterized protein LOC121873470 isoform X1 [Homarus americanus]|nr:uncharacterized protein LOC121873470 isoform X1 [Homarus americanus]